MVRLRILGGVELFDRRNELVTAVLRQPKRLTLFVRLCVLPPDTYLRRDVLCALFWPEADSQHARAALRSNLHAIRRDVGDVVATRGNDEIGITAGTVTCDVTEFAGALRRSDWRAALDLYRGDFLEGVHVTDASAELDHWIETARSQHREMAVGAAWALSRMLEHGGDGAGALESARRAMTWGNVDEGGVRRLLHLHVRLGDRAGAIAAFERFRRDLHEQLELEPSAETLALVSAVRAGQSLPSAAPEPPLPYAPEPRVAADRGTSAPSPRTRRRGLALGLAAAALLIAAVAVRAGFLARRGFAESAHSPSYSEWAASTHAALRVASLPTPLAHMSAVYNALHDQVYVFGGLTGPALSSDFWMMNAVSNAGAVTWTRIDPRGTRPPARQLHSTVYDSTTDEMIVFGGALGNTAPCANDVWILRNPSRRSGDPSWLRLAAIANAPAPRADHSATWIPGARRMIVFGGHDCVARRFNDTWALLVAADGAHAQWRRLHTTAPAPATRSNHSAVYDADRDRVIVFGGVKDPVAFDDVWALEHASSDSAAWHRLQVIGDARPRLVTHRAAWDPRGRQMLVFGGTDDHGNLSGTIWALRDAGADAVQWSALPTYSSGPPDRTSAAVVYNPELDELVVLGGESPGAMRSDAWLMMNVSQRRLRH